MNRTLLLLAALSLTPGARLQISPEAVNWQPAVIAHPNGLVPTPPAATSKAEMDELVAWQQKRTGQDLQAIAYWNDVPVPLRWSEEARAEIITASMVPPRAARALAVVHAAMYDAMLVTWKAKAQYKRALPVQENAKLEPVAGDARIPSYPSEHAAISMAAAVALGALFPDHRQALLDKAKLVGETRIAAAAARRSDVNAGFKLGEAVAREVLAARSHDGTERPNPAVPRQAGKWWVAEPMESGAGSWHPWLLNSGRQFRMTYDRPVVAAAYQEVVDAHARLTPHQLERAIYWNFDVPAILWNDIARRATVTGRKPAKPDSMGIIWSDIARRSAAGYDVPHAARMLNVLHLTLSDAFIACWDTKYANRVQRPYMLAPSDKPLQTVVPTPPHPSWPSGHATASMAAATVLSHYFPAQRTYFEEQAREAAMSRLWGGIHFRKDNEDGLKLGKRVGDYCIQQAEAKGWLR